MFVGELFGKCVGSNVCVSGCRVFGRCVVESCIDLVVKCIVGMGSKLFRIVGVMYVIWWVGVGRNIMIVVGVDGWM